MQTQTQKSFRRIKLRVILLLTVTSIFLLLYAFFHANPWTLDKKADWLRRVTFLIHAYDNTDNDHKISSLAYALAVKFCKKHDRISAYQKLVEEYHVESVVDDLVEAQIKEDKKQIRQEILQNAGITPKS